MPLPLRLLPLRHVLHLRAMLHLAATESTSHMIDVVHYKMELMNRKDARRGALSKIHGIALILGDEQGFVVATQPVNQCVSRIFDRSTTQSAICLAWVECLSSRTCRRLHDEYTARYRKKPDPLLIVDVQRSKDPQSWTPGRPAQAQPVRQHFSYLFWWRSQ